MPKLLSEKRAGSALTFGVFGLTPQRLERWSMNPSGKPSEDGYRLEA